MILALIMPLLALAGTPRDWSDYWREVPASELPAIAPDGDLAAYQIGIERQPREPRRDARQDADTGGENLTGIAPNFGALRDAKFGERVGG